MFDLQASGDSYADNPADYFLDDAVNVSENPKLTRYLPVSRAHHHFRCSD